jgi:hypothetical protein
LIEESYETIFDKWQLEAVELFKQMQLWNNAPATKLLQQKIKS